jgi:rRNA maturation endonuclease Nob1
MNENVDVEALFGMKELPKDTCKKIAEFFCNRPADFLCVERHILLSCDNGSKEVIDALAPRDDRTKATPSTMNNDMHKDMMYLESKGIPKVIAKTIYMAPSGVDQRMWKTVHSARSKENALKILDAVAEYALCDLTKATHAGAHDVARDEKKILLPTENGKSVLEKVKEHYNALKNVSVETLKNDTAKITLENGKRIFVKAEASGNWQNISYGAFRLLSLKMSQGKQDDLFRLVLPTYRKTKIADGYVETAKYLGIQVYGLNKDGGISPYTK